MPPTRKTSGGGRQATLSFNHRVTKPSATKLSAKEAVLEKAVKTAEKKAEAEAEKSTEPFKDNSVPEEKAETAAQDDTQSDAAAADADAEAAEVEAATAPRTGTASRAPTATPAERAAVEAARAVTEAQVRRYWRAIEAQTTARRVHQEGLGVSEKVLQYFDVSSQYGPCTGIERKKRWLRAARLGLDPPIEVLAVLLHEEARGVENVDRSSFDAILNPEVVA